MRPTLMRSDPEVRALDYVLEYTSHCAWTAGGGMPEDILDVVVLGGHGGQEAAATAVGVRLPALAREAPAFAASQSPDISGRK
jgi:hypothetical protein